MTPSRDISRLIEIMAALRTPVTGCPWDLEQNFATIVPYTIEEAYEVADAITRGDFDDLREELGDLLLQVVYHARMAEEQNAFAFGDVVEAITRRSACLTRFEPSGRYSRSCRNRSNFDCAASGRQSTSSRNSVPPSASATRPSRAPCAFV